MRRYRSSGDLDLFSRGEGFYFNLSLLSILDRREIIGDLEMEKN